MKILVTSINFHPDHSGIALYSTDLPVYFAEKGHTVTMVTAFPYYPQWKKRKEDERRLFGKEIFKGVTTLRGYIYVPYSVTTLTRIVHELSFIFFAFLNFIRARRQDCIVIISPPLLLGLVGVFFKKLWDAKLVFHIQDLQPDAALSLGMVKESLLIKVLKKAEAFIYRNSDRVVTISRGMQEKLASKGVPENKLALFYNWIDVADASAPREKGLFRGEYPYLRGKFIIVYAGNIGIKQGVDTLIELAEATVENENVHYVIIGEGADKPRLIKIAAKKMLNNLTFLPFMGQNKYFEMLQDIDIFFISQRSGSGNVFFPSKLLGIMAHAKPMLISADLNSELATVICNAHCGLVAAAGDVNGLRKHVETALMDRARLRQMGDNGYTLVKQYDREVVLSSFLSDIIKMKAGI